MANPRAHDRLAIFKLIPPKLALTLIAVAIAYAFLQPMVNAKFGWTLPSLAAMADLDFRPPAQQPQNSKPTKPSADRNSQSVRENSPPPSGASSIKVSDLQDAPDKPPAPVDSPKSTASTEASRVNNGSVTSATGATRNATADQAVQVPPKSESPAKTVDKPTDTQLRYGVLKPLGRDRFESPAGLVYGPGSQEGHRLKHIERHLADQPNRPGSHGVFDGDMTELLKAIDDAYSRAERGAKGTNRRAEDDAIVYEASFSRQIGYLGGTEGKSRKNPKLKRMRIVVSKSNNMVITAFPF